MGAKVINVSVTACVSAADPLDQGVIGAAVWYAATVKDAVIVAAAGNDSEDGCAQNPSFDPLTASDPRDWHQVKTVSSPSWFSDYVLSVGAVDNSGARSTRAWPGRGWPPRHRASGSWGCPRQRGDRQMPTHRSIPGTRTCRSGVPAFRRPMSAGWPRWSGPSTRGLSAHQIINRILQTAHNPPRGVDNQVGYGVVDPVAALTFDVPAGERLPLRPDPGDQAGRTATAAGPSRPHCRVGICRCRGGRDRRPFR